MQSIYSKDQIQILKSAMGKNDEDLYDHLEKTGIFTNEVVGRINISKEAIEALSEISINENLLKEIIVLQGFNHDLGKLDRWFQNKLRGADYWDGLCDCKSFKGELIKLKKKFGGDFREEFIKSSEDIRELEKKIECNEESDFSPGSIKCFIRNELCPMRPHALFSLPLVKKSLETFLDNDPTINPTAKKILIYVSLLSVATHHSDYHPDLYASYQVDEALYEGLDFRSSESYQLLKDAYNFVGKLKPSLLRYLYVLFNGTLRMSDWSASGNLPFKEVLLEKNELKFRVNNFISTKFGDLRDYQQFISNFDFKSSGHLKLPTGDGKTETALLANLTANKLIYTLPTITTIESMRHRFEDYYFDKNTVSFSHHLLFLSLYKEGRINEKVSHKYFMKKAVVTSIDRILLSLMNCKNYPLLEISLNNSYMVVDEIHSYSPYTLSLILNALEYLQKYHNTKILVMSATLPSLIEKELHKRLNSVEILPENMVKRRYTSKKRVKLEYKEENLENYINEIIKLFKAGQKILVIFNTVNRAVKMYNALKNRRNIEFKRHILLLHSRFNQSDREEKNEFLETLKKVKFEKKPFILVSTQVVEVSLDIDFDVMYTEISPFDSLVQRCGRINRKGEKGVRNVFIFDIENNLPYEKSQIEETKSILENFKNINEWEFIEANNKYYNSLEDEYTKEFGRNGLSDFLERISRSKFGDMISTRDSFLSIPVIPAGANLETYTQIKELIDNWNSLEFSERRDARITIMKKIVNVPIYTAKKLKPEPMDDFGFTFIQSGYNSEVGIIPIKNTMIW